MMNTTRTDQSIYRSLDDSTDEIRLIRLQQDSRDGELRCTLETVSLDKQPVFHALSYVWGSGTDGQINVNGSTIPITSSLAVVLKHFRSHHYDHLELHSTPLWIDAVCINQADFTERAKQVILMRRIYRQASYVLLWIGEGDEFSDYAFDQMNNATFRASCGDLRTTSRTPTMDEIRVRIIIEHNLESRRYWTRGWIFQEVVLATKDPVIICGSRRMPWSWYIHSKDALPLDKMSYPSLILEWHTIQQEVPLHQDFEPGYRGSMSIAVLRDQYQQEGFIMLGFALTETIQLNTTDPRDHVYGILGLVPVYELMVDINYRKTPEEVFRDTMAALWTSGTPDLIGYIIPTLLSGVGAHDRLDLPSWVPDLARRESTLHGGFIWLMHSPEFWRPHQQAAVTFQGNSLIVKGIKFDTIGETIIWDTWEAWVAFYRRGEVPSEGDLETLRSIEAIAHRGLGIPIPASSRLLPFRKLRDKIPIWSAFTSWPESGKGWLPGVPNDKAKLWEILLGRQPIPDDWKSAADPALQSNPVALQAAIISPIVTAIRRTTLGNKIFISRFGFLGVGTKQVEPGDVITLIKGMRLMYVLRPFHDGYRIMGFAKVSGLMDWDDLDQALAASSLPEEVFKIY